MNSWLALAGIGLTLLVSTAASALPLLQPYVAEYQLLRGGQESGRSTIRLERAGDGDWTMRSDTRGTHGLAALTGIEIHETSEFSSRGKHLDCRHYQYRQTGLRKRERSVDCGAGEAGIRSRDHHGEYHFPARAGILDRQIVSLALALELAAGKRGEMSFSVVDREKLDTQHYRTLGEETLDVAGVPTHTLKLERLHDSPTRKTTTWYAPEQGWIPVRILHSDKDGGYELRLLSLQR